MVAELYQVPLAAHHDPQIHVHAVAASPTGFILESFADPTRDPLGTLEKMLRICEV